MPEPTDTHGLVFRHIVLFTVRPQTPDAKITEAIALLEALCKSSTGILHSDVVRSLDAHKGIVIVECIDFLSESAFRKFCESDAHRKAGEFMSMIADWPTPGDYFV